MAPKIAVTTQERSHVPAVNLPQPVIREVRLALQPMLRMQASCCGDLAQPVRGELLGLEMAGGVLEITNCYTVQNTKSTATPDASLEAITAAAARDAKTASKYRSKVRELYDSVDADPQVLGIWLHQPNILSETTYVGAPVSLTDLDELYERCQLVDPASILLTYSSAQRDIGRFPFTAYRLSKEYMQLRLDHERGIVDAESYKRSVSRLGCGIFSEIPCVPHIQPHDTAIATLATPADSDVLARDQRIVASLLQTRERELDQMNHALTKTEL